MAKEHYHYAIHLKKGDLFLELSSDDVYFIARQMDDWLHAFLKAEEFPSMAPALPQAATNPPAPAPVLSPEPVAEEAVAPVEEPPPPPVPDPEPVVDTTPEPVAETIAEPTPEPVVETVVEPSPVESTPEPAPEPSPVPTPEPVAEQVSSPAVESSAPLEKTTDDDLDAFLDTLMEDMEKSPEPDDFSDILEPEKTATATTSSRPARPEGLRPQNGSGTTMPPPIVPQPETSASAEGDLADSFAALCKRATPANTEEQLVLAAYYLTFYQAEPKFSLKQVNELLAAAELEAANHSTLEVSLEKSYLTMLPDTTGTATVTEYTLAEPGQLLAERLM